MDFEGGGSCPHGTKRRAEEELANDQRLIKRFNLLNLERNGKLYTSDTRKEATGSSDFDESMQLDDTKHKVYIYNLDAELESVDRDEEKVVFLPDVERKLNKIPKSLLRSHAQTPANSEMVLYRVPSSLTVPEENDNVRRAIIECRDRARQKQAEEPKLGEQGITMVPALNNEQWRQGSSETAESEIYEVDEDAMDLG